MAAPNPQHLAGRGGRVAPLLRRPHTKCDGSVKWSWRGSEDGGICDRDVFEARDDGTVVDLMASCPQLLMQFLTGEYVEK